MNLRIWNPCREQLEKTKYYILLFHVANAAYSLCLDRLDALFDDRYVSQVFRNLLIQKRNRLGVA